jgi:hypothetical protein
MASASARSKVFRVTRVVRRSLLDPLHRPWVQRLTRRLLSLRRRLIDDCVDSIVRLGGIVDEVRTRLRDCYRRWLRSVNLSPSTARRWILVYRLARRAPALVREWKRLGATKLYQVARLTPEGQHRLARLNRDSLKDMNNLRFIGLTAPHVRVALAGTPAQRAYRVGEKLKSWARQLEALLTGDLLRHADPVKLIGALHRLIQACRKLDAALHRGKTA